MPSLISYLIEKTGAEFNQLLVPADRAVPADIDAMIRAGEFNFWEGRLPCSEADFLLDLSGTWTHCKLPLPYSLFLCAESPPDKMARVFGWEKCLLECVGSVRVFRFDDNLMEKWNTEYDYCWLRNPQVVKAILDWLITQDHRYWAQIANRQ